MTSTTLRKAEIDTLVGLLKDQKAAKYDAVISPTSIRSEGGLIVVKGGGEPILSDDGVTTGDLTFAPTQVFDEGLSDKLSIPRAYLRRLRETEGATDLLDANVNTWLDLLGKPWLIRAFRDTEGGVGLARAFLSDRYRFTDHLDVLFAALAGLREAGVTDPLFSVDLSERRMSVKVTAPSIQALAPTLLKDYRSPFTGAAGADNPIVFGGLVISNSETGGGAFSITPRLEVEVCRNGMTLKSDAERHIHLGGRLEEGTIDWSEDTQRKHLELVAARTRDAVATFLSPEYVERKVREIESKSTRPVEAPAKAIEIVAKEVGFTEAEADSILGFFVKGGDATAGGVMQAVTAFAQEVEDPDRACEIEESALDVLAVAAR